MRLHGFAFMPGAERPARNPGHHAKQRDNDVKINNPHVLQVEDGKQGVIRPDVVAVKQSLDPAGLLNPGKLRGWALRDKLELDSNPLARATRETPTT